MVENEGASTKCAVIYIRTAETGPTSPGCGRKPSVLGESRRRHDSSGQSQFQKWKELLVEGRSMYGEFVFLETEVPEVTVERKVQEGVE